MVIIISSDLLTSLFKSDFGIITIVFIIILSNDGKHCVGKTSISHCKFQDAVPFNWNRQVLMNQMGLQFIFTKILSQFILQLPKCWGCSLRFGVKINAYKTSEVIKYGLHLLMILQFRNIELQKTFSLWQIIMQINGRYSKNIVVRRKVKINYKIIRFKDRDSSYYALLIISQNL